MTTISVLPVCTSPKYGSYFDSALRHGYKALLRRSSNTKVSIALWEILAHCIFYGLQWLVPADQHLGRELLRTARKLFAALPALLAYLFFVQEHLWCYIELEVTRVNSTAVSWAHLQAKEGATGTFLPQYKLVRQTALDAVLAVSVSFALCSFVE